MVKTREELQNLFIYLSALIRHPVQEIQKLPEIEWKTLLIFQFILTFTSVVLSNILAPYAISLVQVFISLSAGLIAISLICLFFYYFFLILYEKQLPFIKIFSLVLFAHIPFALFHLASAFFPPADLIGLGISAILMIVGLVENFRIPKKLATQLMVGLYSIFFIYWSLNLVVSRQYRQTTTPQDLDKIEKEIHETLKQ